MLAGDLLHNLGQRANLSSILLVGSSNAQRQQVPKRVDSRVHLRFLAPFGAVVATARAGLGRRLQCAAVEDHGRWLGLAPDVFAQQHA